MRSPKDMQVIQIEVTNKCNRTCANCTRMCGYARPFEMDAEYFEKALRSLGGYRGIVGIMGGEPLLHPEFEKLCKVMQQERPRSLCGLWSAMPKDYWKHFDLIQDTFGYQNLNDHSGEVLHQPLLVASEDVVRDDVDRVWYQAHCWVQAQWSACITPQGAYFCEVAPVLNELSGERLIEPIPLTDEWWKIDPLHSDFFHQAQICDKCGGCLPLERTKDTDRAICASSYWYSKLVEKKNVPHSIRLVGDGVLCDTDEWLEGRAKYAQGQLVSKKNREKLLDLARAWNDSRGEKLERVTVCVDYDDVLSASLDATAGLFDTTIVVTSPQDAATQKLCRSRYDVELVVTDRFYENGAPFNKGAALNEAFKRLKYRQWVCLIDADIVPGEQVAALRSNAPKLNRSMLYTAHRRQRPDGTVDWDYDVHAKSSYPAGFFSMFHCHRVRWNPIYPENWPAANGSDTEFAFRFTNGTFTEWAKLPITCQHLVPGEVNWKGRVSEKVNVRRRA